MRDVVWPTMRRWREEKKERIDTRGTNDLCADAPCYAASTLSLGETAWRNASEEALNAFAIPVKDHAPRGAKGERRINAYPTEFRPAVPILRPQHWKQFCVQYPLCGDRRSRRLQQNDLRLAPATFSLLSDYLPRRRL